MTAHRKIYNLIKDHFLVSMGDLNALFIDFVEDKTRGDSGAGEE